jgi:penicillin-insensitive murein endopeptidase
MRKRIFLFAILLSLFPSCYFASEAIGYYSKGSILNSLDIGEFNDHHIVKLYKPRGQNYGTKEIHLALTGLADFMKKNFNTVEKVQIGDISARHGGKIKRHVSHQNGLDADVVYFRRNEFQQPEDYPEWMEDFVKNGRLTSNFHMARNWAAFKYLVHNHNIGRIFVDGVIRDEICSYAKLIGEYTSETEVLRRIRPENTVHKHHFHFRLKCPSGNYRCKAQKEPNPGPGC